MPAAIENVITENVAKSLSHKVILEAANHPTTPEADKLLAERGITVLPDILVNGGGVTVSYFEWTQNLQQFSWQEEEVNNELKLRMKAAYNTVAKKVKKSALTFREAAFAIAVEKVGCVCIIAKISFLFKYMSLCILHSVEGLNLFL